MYPFSEYNLRDVISEQHNKLSKHVNKYTNDEIMANDFDLLADNCYEKFSIEPVVIGDEEFDKRFINQTKIKKKRDKFLSNIDGIEFIYIDGVEMMFYFNYTGDSELFKCQASTYSSFYPEIKLTDNYIAFKYSATLYETEQPDYREKIMERLQRDLELIKNGTGYVNKDVERYNNGLREMAVNLLEERKKKIEQFYTISKAFEVPLKKTEYAQQIHIPAVRKINPIKKFMITLQATMLAILSIQIFCLQ